MTFHEDISAVRKEIEAAIKKYGFAPEHNVDCFLYASESYQKPIFINWPDGTGLLTHKEDKDWYTFSEPIAPTNLRGQRVVEFSASALNQSGIKKVVTESRVDTRKEILKSLPSIYKARSINYTLNWPVMNMEKFDPTLPGGHFKSLRNAKNKFYKEHEVEVKEAKSIKKELLHEAVNIWVKLRKHSDRAYKHSYINAINAGFVGLKSARAMIVDGKPVGFNAGWDIPNSNMYYAGIGIHDYSVQDLGLMLYLEDLEWIKKAGYKIADMGGVEKGGPLNFKSQFLPESWYKTFVFSIVKK